MSLIQRKKRVACAWLPDSRFFGVTQPLLSASFAGGPSSLSLISSPAAAVIPPGLYGGCRDLPGLFWVEEGQLSSHTGRGGSRLMWEEPVPTVMPVLKICLHFLLVHFCWPWSDFVSPPLLTLLFFTSSSLCTSSPQSNADPSPGSSVGSPLHTPVFLNSAHTQSDL